MSQLRHHTWIDKICIGFDQALKALTHDIQATGAAYPADGLDQPAMSPAEAKQSAGLMRVNHTGEVCAQALYHGQALVTANPALKAQLGTAALEEGDHLVWCKRRLDELQSHTSYLNPLWYAGSFCIGAVAGLIGDDWSLGFVVETEKQVIQHLEDHLKRLPVVDLESAAILKRMEQDEAHHRDEAKAAGARALPPPVKGVMRLMSKVMVNTAYYV